MYRRLHMSADGSNEKQHVNVGMILFVIWASSHHAHTVSVESEYISGENDDFVIMSSCLNMI